MPYFKPFKVIIIGFDGVLGSASREAIKREQSRLGMNADGRAGRKLLEALRAGR